MLNPTTLILGGPVVTTLAVDILKGTIGGLYSVISHFCTSKEPCITTLEVKTYLERHDILFKLQYVELKLKLLEKDVLVTPLMEDICKKILEELTWIQTQLNEHSKKWFSGWRHSGIRLDRLDMYCNVLDERMKLFIHL
jgi:hypothetical protein